MNMNPNIFRLMTLFNQFAFHMLVPIFICSYVGYWLDQKLKTVFLFIVFFFIGAVAGGRNVYLLAQKVYDSKETKPSERYAANHRPKHGKEEQISKEK